MFTQGHSLIEVLVALALATVVFSGAWTAQWFARQQLQLSFEQLQAITLVRELHQLLSEVPALRRYAADCVVVCPLPSELTRPLTSRLQFFQQSGLTHLQLCVSATDILVSWQSTVAAQVRQRTCGGGSRQQVGLAW